jgi:hypothetical protein
MNKNIIAIAIASLGFVIGLGILGNAIKNRNKSENTISVTGLGTKNSPQTSSLGTEVSQETILNLKPLMMNF